jgi:polar amino acid transport system substrate-binding protein
MAGRRLIIGVLAGLLLAAGARAAEPAPAADITIVTAEFPPYAMMRDGQSGVIVEIVREMALRAGRHALFDFQPWPRAQKTAQERPDVLIIPLTRTPEREPHYQWIAPVLDDEMVLIASAADAPIRDFAAAKDLRVGVQHDSPGESFLIDRGFRQLAPAVDESTSARKLALGRIDAWFVRQLVATQTARDVGDDPAKLMRGATWKTPPMYLAGAPRLPTELADALRRALAAMHEDGGYDRIVTRYR